MNSPTARELPLTLELPSSLYREIGRIVAAHALLEWTLSRIIYILLDIEPVHGRITIREPRTTDRLDMIADLMKLKNIKTGTDLPALRQLLEGCSTQRDWLVHGVWVQDDKYPGKNFLRIASGSWQPPGSNIKVKRRIDLEAIEYDATEAGALRQVMVETLHATVVLRQEIEAALAALPQKSPVPSLLTNPQQGHIPTEPSDPQKSSGA